MAVTQKFGFDEAMLRETPTVFAPGLFEGRVVLTSGSGLARAIACLYARLGAAVAICGRNEEKLEAAATLLGSFGSKVLARPTNIRDPDDVDAFHDGRRPADRKRRDIRSCRSERKRQSTSFSQLLTDIL